MQSSSQIITTNKPAPNFLQTGCPSCHPTNSDKAVQGKNIQCFSYDCKFQQAQLTALTCNIKKKPSQLVRYVNNTKQRPLSVVRFVLLNCVLFNKNISP